MDQEQANKSAPMPELSEKLYEQLYDEYSDYVSADSLDTGMQERPDPATDADLEPLIIRICEFFNKLKSEQGQQQTLYQPGGEWEIYLQSQQPIYRPIHQSDIPAATALLRNFWRNDLGPVVKQYATFQNLKSDAITRDRFIDLMAYDLMVWRNLFDTNLSELQVPLVGNPWGYQYEDVLIAPKGLRYHALAQQITNITSGMDRPVIAEIGAGYGGTAYQLLKGKSPITYVNFDLPEVLTIAAYYLSRACPHRKITLWQPDMTVSSEDLSESNVLLLPNWMLPELPSTSVDLFLNTFSLSEMPVEVVSEYISHIERCCRGYFLYNNMDRQGVLSRGHERVPCSEYPVSKNAFRELYKRYDLFQRLHFGRDGDYREVLLQKI